MRFPLDADPCLPRDPHGTDGRPGTCGESRMTDSNRRSLREQAATSNAGMEKILRAIATRARGPSEISRLVENAG